MLSRVTNGTKEHESALQQRHGAKACSPESTTGQKNTNPLSSRGMEQKHALQSHQRDKRTRIRSQAEAWRESTLSRVTNGTKEHESALQQRHGAKTRSPE